MKNDELVGKIIQLIDSENGIIHGEDEKDYIFSKMDFIQNFDAFLEEEVIFKPKVYKLRNADIYKALLIEKK